MNSLSILLVEDEGPKRTHIERFLKESVSKLNVNNANSVTSALRSLEESLPDLLILDMSLPTFDIGIREGGGRPQGFGGIEVMRHMQLAGLVCPTVVITGYEAFVRDDGPVDLSKLTLELQTEFPDFMCGVLHFNSTYDEWKQSLAETLSNLGVKVEEIKIENPDI